MNIKNKNMNPEIWYKYREHMAWGIGEWKYITIPTDFAQTKSHIFEYLNDHNLLSTWSEHYRRTEVKKTNKIPKKIIQDKIKSLSMTIKDNQKTLKWLKQQNKE